MLENNSLHWKIPRSFAARRFNALVGKRGIGYFTEVDLPGKFGRLWKSFSFTSLRKHPNDAAGLSMKVLVSMMSREGT